MKLKLLLLFLFGFLAISNCQDQNEEINVDAAEEPEEPEPQIKFDENIIIVDDGKFKEMKEKNTTMLVLFFAHWCFHCKHFSPEYSKLPSLLKQTDLDIKVAAMDATQSQEAVMTENIEGFPTLKFYHEGKVYNYEGPRESEKIITFAEKRIKGAVRVLKTVEEVKEFSLNRSRVLLLLVDPDANNSVEELKSAVKDFYEVAREEDLIDFAHCYSKECADEYKAPVVFLRKFDEPIIYWPRSDAIVKSTIERFIAIYRFELCSEIDEFGADYMIDNNKTVLLYFRDSNNETQTNADKVFKKVHEDFRDTIIVFKLDVKGKDLFEAASNFFGVTESDLPSVFFVMFNGEEYKNYPCNLTIDENLSSEDMRKWIYSVYDEKVQRLPNSEPVPEQQTENYYVIVGRTFDKLVMKSDKNVVILFVGQGCDEDCQKADGYFQVLGDKYNNDESADILFAKMDMNFNEVFGLSIKKFPQIMAYVKGKKDAPLTYEGELATIDIENWVAEKVGWQESTHKKKEESDKHKEDL